MATKKMTKAAGQEAAKTKRTRKKATIETVAKAAGQKRRGRPKKISDEDIIKDADVYLNECEYKFNHADNTKALIDSIPQVITFAKRQQLTRQALYVRADKNEQLFDTIKKITEAKELMLENGALCGLFNPSTAIFSLKQLGWRDKIETENETKHEIVVSMGGDLDEYAD